MAKAKDMDWLVKRRSRIQFALLRLHNCAEEHEDKLRAPAPNLKWDLFGLLLGASFSLWRAAFFAEGPRQQEEVFEDGATFLARLVRDNIINYPQDREARRWAVGHYLSNAWFRLEEIQTKLNEAGISLRESEKRAFSFDRSWRERWRDPQKLWDEAFQVVKAGIRILLRLLEGTAA